MLKILLIVLFIIPPILFLLPCIEMAKNGEKSEMYQKAFNEIRNYSKDNGIDVDDDDIRREINRCVRQFTFVTIAIIMMILALLCLVFK